MNELMYLRPESQQTLREAIWELRQAEGAEGDAAETVSPELLNDIEVHDAIHVVFACPTNLTGEILAHIWTALGTTLEMKEMHRVNMHSDHKTVLREIGHARLLRAWLRSIPRIIGVLWRVFIMKRPWPADRFEQYLEVSLWQIRTEFNIRVYEVKGEHTASGGAALRSVRGKYREVNVV